MHSNFLKQSVLLSGLFLITSSMFASSASLHPDTSNWQPLFKQNLSNSVVREGVWSMRNDVLTATEDSMLCTSKVYDNFMLDLEFKFGPGANSGIVVYCTDIRNWIPNSVEIQIADDHAETFADRPLSHLCGAIFGHKAATRQNVVKAAGEWNHMTVKCEDHLITVILNNELVNVFDMRAWTSAETNPDGLPIPAWLNRPKAELPTYGHIGLQGKHGDADISFRNVKILELQ